MAVALAEFDGVWQALSPREQAKALGLVGRVEYDAAVGNVAITFNSAGMKAVEAAANLEETAA